MDVLETIMAAAAPRPGQRRTSVDKLRDVLEGARTIRPRTAAESAAYLILGPMLGRVSVPDDPAGLDDVLARVAGVVLSLQSDPAPTPLPRAVELDELGEAA